MAKIATVVLTIIVSSGLVVFSILLHVLFGWVAGWVTRIFCGQFIAAGLNAVFDTQRFSPNMLPLLGGTLGFIGSFFKAGNNNSSSKIQQQN